MADSQAGAALVDVDPVHARIVSGQLRAPPLTGSKRGVPRCGRIALVDQQQVLHGFLLMNMVAGQTNGRCTNGQSRVTRRR